MPDIYDPERGLKIGLTDEDYENYQNGNLSDDFYARRTDGSIANRVTISPLDDDNDEDGEPSGGIDPGSAVIGALIMATIAGATYGIKKLWDRHKAKKAETQVNVRKEEGTQLSTETACEVLSTETAKSNDAEPKSLTQEEAKGDKLVIRSFYPMNLLQKLSLQKEYVEDWRQLVDSIMIDWNYDGVVMQPVVTDIPDKSEMVSGIYDIPENAGTIKVKITDLLSESLEVEVR